MKKKIKIITLSIIIVAIIFFLLIITCKYSSWWLNIIGSITGIKNKFGQWSVATLLDVVLTIGIIRLVVFIGDYLTQKRK